MKFFFDLGNRYAKTSTWQDFALVKFCLCAMGVLLGLSIPEKARKPAAGAALSVFLVTYIPLMRKVFSILNKMIKEQVPNETAG